MSARHIAISGELGSGKTTVARLISNERGLKLVSTGEIHRAIAAELNLSTLETNLLAETDRVIDTRVDGVTRELSETATETMVFDSRFAWNILRTSFRVRLVLDPDVAARRIFSRAADSVERYSSLEEAARKIAERYESEVRRFRARYGVDVTFLRHYNLVIDTSDAAADEVAAVILSDYDSGRDEGTRLLVSPARLTPAYDADVAGHHDVARVSVVYSRPHVCAVSGRERVAEALMSGASLLEVDLVAEGLDEVVPGVTADAFVKERLALNTVS